MRDAYDSVFEMWRALILYTLGVNAVLYLLVGLIASRQTGTPVRMVLFTILALLVGIVITFLHGAVPSLLIASLYVNVPSDMSHVEAVVLGCGQGVIIAMYNAGCFHRLF